MQHNIRQMHAQTPKIGLVSLGCPKALVDSEHIVTRLRADGYELCDSYEESDLVVVNTCGFIDAAKRESLETIGEALGENGRVVVTGCMGADPAEIRAIHPAVLAISGPQQSASVLDAVRTHAPRPTFDPRLDLVPEQGIKLTPPHYAYVKISEGCNHKCSFCIIPSMRGKLRSRTLPSIVGEARRLVRAGVKELLIISQDTSAYGLDRRYEEVALGGQQVRTDLEHLVDQLADEGLWIRLHYVYPYPHVDRLLPMMAEGRLLPYLDVPLQHASTRILKRMRRPAAKEKTLERILRWREQCPELTIRSTFIVGFPGETESDFTELLDFLDTARLDRVGCFCYSPVAGAVANELDGAVDPEEAEARRAELMRVQEQISAARLQEKQGKTLECVVDEVDASQTICRSQGDAPEIDGLVYLRDADPGIRVGDRVHIRIEDSDEHDLYGVAV